MPIVPRHAARRVREYLDVFRVVQITGARQVGKTTLARSIGGERRYVSLDEAADRRRCEDDPTGFLRSLGDGDVLIDEVQRVPDILLAIKREVDERPQPGRFLITGSAEVRARASTQDSLAGRMGVVQLRALSQGEINRKSETFVERACADEAPAWGSAAERGFSDYAERAARGGYPDIFDRDDRARALRLRAYLDDVLSRDVRTIVDVADFGKLRRVFTILAASSGGLLSKRSVARDAELAAGTASTWLDLIAATHLVDVVPGWGGSHRRRVVRMPKVYVSDPGLLVAALGTSPERILGDTGLTGALAETFVVQEILRQASFIDERIDLYHYRDRDQREVDVILERGDGRIVPIEVKSSATVGPRDARHIASLARSAPDRFLRGIVLYCGEHPFELVDGVDAVPIAELWR